MINYRQTPKGNLSDLRNEITASQVKVIKPNGDIEYQPATYFSVDKRKVITVGE